MPGFERDVTFREFNVCFGSNPKVKENSILDS
jgi:hypothetical protein